MALESPARRVRQRGAALLISMLLFFIGSMTWLLVQGNIGDGRRTSDKATAAALAEAKAALIGRAAQDENRPGSLPCPDINNDGNAESFSGSHCPSYIGRLPWKTLNLPDLRDGHGERLWYALTPELRDSTAAQPINLQTALQLSLDGTANFAALVLSAGPPLANQSGRPSNTASDYLDGSNGDGDIAYISGPVSPSFNDTVLAISREDIFRTVNMRVLGEIRGPDDDAPSYPYFGLRRYHGDNGTFPWADTDNDGESNVGANIGRPPYKDLVFDSATYKDHLINPGWLNANKWVKLISYQRVNADSVTISIGSSKMTVVPCSSSPCP